MIKISVSAGIVLAILSLILNGSFSSCNKLPRVVKSRIDPLIFNLYFSIGVIMLSVLIYIILLLMGETVHITYLGIISGFLLSLAAAFTFVAIANIGLSIGIAIWSGTAIIVSFLEGLIEKEPNYLSYAIIGLIITIIGIIGVAFSEEISQYFFGVSSVDNFDNIKNDYPEKIESNINKNNDNDNNNNQTEDNNTTARLSTSEVYEKGPENNNISEISEAGEHQTLINKDDQGIIEEEMDIANWFLGLFYALLTGICGGSVGFPTLYTDDDTSGAKFLISFAIGVTLVFPLTFLYYWIFSNTSIKWNFKPAFGPGIFSGIIWNCANLCSIYAIKGLGYSVAYPIMQSSLVVGAMWGIFVWKEFTEPKVITIIFFFCAVVLGGCGLITYGVDG